MANTRMSRYENGVHEPSFTTVARLANAPKVPTAYFFCEGDELAKVILRWPHLSAEMKELVISQIESCPNTKN